MLYEELGNAYTQAKVFGLAIQAYEKSLEFNPGSPQVHYNLGLLYQHYKNDAKKSLYHLKKSLRLNPLAENKKEIEYLIDIISK